MAAITAVDRVQEHGDENRYERSDTENWERGQLKCEDPKKQLQTQLEEVSELKRVKAARSERDEGLGIDGGQQKDDSGSQERHLARDVWSKSEKRRGEVEARIARDQQQERDEKVKVLDLRNQGEDDGINFRIGKNQFKTFANSFLRSKRAD